MISTRMHRWGATSFFALVAAGLLPGPVQGEVAMAEIAPVAVPAVELAKEESAPALEAAPVEAPVVEEKKVETKKVLAQPFAEGVASFYGSELAGNRTANGERFNPNALTAAHRSLPMGTKVRVTNKANGKSVIVRINDRGPFAKKRILDVSKAAAQQISMVRSGTARVAIDIIG
jgi:rare lipoprotein A